MKIDCKPLQEILNFLKVMCADNATVIPTESGWEFYARDPSACAMVSALLKKDAFPEGYEVWEPFAAEMDFLRDNTAKRDKVDLEVNDGYMRITYEKSKSKRRLFALDETPRTIPRVRLESSVAVLSDKLLELAGNKYMANTGAPNGLKVETSEQEITFSCECDIDAYSETYDVLMANLPKEGQTCHFAPQYLIPVFKTLPKGVPVVIDMDNDKPMKLTLQTELNLINIYIAPRIPED